MARNISPGPSIFILLLLCLTLMLSACGSEQTTPVSPTSLPSPSASTTPVLPTFLTSPTVIITPTQQPIPTNSPIPTKLNLPQDWQHRWLKNIPCAPPCWEGVTPGKTSAKEAVQIFRQSPIIALAEIRTSRLAGSDDGTVDLEWFEQTGIRGIAFYHAQTSAQIIYHINPRISIYTLAEIIKAFGEPTHVAATFITNYVPTERDPYRWTLHCEISFIYLPQGFAVSTTKTSQMPIISADMLLEELDFFVPNMDGYKATSPRNSEKELIPWQGFKEFLFYCRSIISNWKGKDCNNIKGSDLLLP